MICRRGRLCVIIDLDKGEGEGGWDLGGFDPGLVELYELRDNPGVLVNHGGALHGEGGGGLSHLAANHVEVPVVGPGYESSQTGKAQQNHETYKANHATLSLT